MADVFDFDAVDEFLAWLQEQGIQLVEAGPLKNVNRVIPISEAYVSYRRYVNEYEDPAAAMPNVPIHPDAQCVDCGHLGGHHFEGGGCSRYSCSCDRARIPAITRPAA